MDVNDEHGNRIGEVVSIEENGTVVMRVKGRVLIAKVPVGHIVRPSVEHHPHCRPECTGDTHYLTSEDVPESHG